MAWGGCPQVVVALKYKWASEKPVDNYGNPTTLLFPGLQLLKFLTGNLQWASAWDRAVSVCLNQEAPNPSTSSKRKSAVLSGQHSSGLGSHPAGNCSLPESHFQTVWNPGPASELRLWCFLHFRPRRQSPHQLLSAASQRCGSVKALQLTCGRCPNDAWTENSFKATASTTFVPGIYPVESCNALTTPLTQWLKPTYPASNHAVNAKSLYWSSSHR